MAARMFRAFGQPALNVALAFACWLWSLSVVAQTPAEITLAREQFTVGVEAARAADWPRALSAFERSYALYVHPETLFNIAGARQKLGQFVAASEAYRSYLRSPAASSDPARRAQAEARLAENAAQFARVGIRVEGLRPNDVLTLDGQPLSRGALDSDLPVDPGEHFLRLMQDQTVVGETQFAVHARERIEVLLQRSADASPVVAAGAVLSPRQAADASLQSDRTDANADRESPAVARPLRKQWWVWTSLGVVAAGGVIATLLLTREPEKSQEVKGNVLTGVVEIP